MYTANNLCGSTYQISLLFTLWLWHRQHVFDLFLVSHHSARQKKMLLANIFFTLAPCELYFLFSFYSHLFYESALSALPLYSSKEDSAPRARRRSFPRSAAASLVLSSEPFFAPVPDSSLGSCCCNALSWLGTDPQLLVPRASLFALLLGSAP